MKLGTFQNFLKFMWSFGQGQNGHFRFRERGHCSLYINNNIYIIVADLTASVFDFDK